MQPSSVSEFDKTCTQFEEKLAINLYMPNSKRMLDTAFIRYSLTRSSLYLILGKTSEEDTILGKRQAFVFPCIIIQYTILGKT